MPLDMDACADGDPPTVAPDWNPDGPTPESLRDYRVVLAHAEPIHDPVKDTYSWVPSLAPWFALNPPAGVVPCEMVELITHIVGRIPSATRIGAIAQLRMAMWIIEKDVRGPLFSP